MKNNIKHAFLATLLAATPSLAFASNGNGAVVWVVVLLGAGAIWFFVAMVRSGVNTAMRMKTAEIEAKERTERAATEDLKRKALAELAAKQAELSKRTEDLAKMRASFSSSYVQGRQWLAQFVAEAYEAPDKALAITLETKKNPARKSAEDLRRVAAEKKLLTEKLKLLEYTLKTYHEYYPVLEQYSEDILNEEASLDLSEEDDDSDRVSRYISIEEYNRLSPSRRNQLALDNWRVRRKSNVEIGRMYERYLGHLYEKAGWTVTYFGATERLEDMGRDLICERGTELHVVQAKHWAKHRTVHEKHIFQLYGTTVLLPLSHRNWGSQVITPVFATTTKLSETATWAAKRLNVQVREEPMQFDYPMIKCNVNGGSKIYHLPFDQQYDRVKIVADKGESYALTVNEAERRGFRRAMRHRMAA
jgi:hypothetical protein